MSKICDIVKEGIETPLLQQGIEIVDMNYEKGRAGQNPTLWIFVFHEDGVDLDLLERVNAIVDPIIEELDPTSGAPFILNISSPGLDRAFTTQRDFERNYGKDVEVKLYSKLDGKKLFEGELVEHTDDYVAIKINGNLMQIENKLISKVNLAIKFN